MSLVYKDRKDVKTFVSFDNQSDGRIHIVFENDGGKFGTYETLDEYTLSPDRLLEILQDRNDYKDDEL